MNGCEVWGFAKENILEKLHSKFCKQILGIRQNSCELGNYPLYINRYIRIVKYWLRIINTDNIILRTVINTCLNDAHNGRINWFSDVKNLLSRCVLCVWENPSITSTNVLISNLRKWRTNINTSHVLILYNPIKEHFRLEPYLENIFSKKLRSEFTKISVFIV